MARRVFFSFHFGQDAWRAGQVRNAWVTKPASDYVDWSDWEAVRKRNDDAIRRWINEQLVGCSVTAVLIGEHTADRKWVMYEIERSWKEGKGLLGIRIHNLQDQDRRTTPRGRNPFDDFTVGGQKLSQIVNVYSWVSDNGYNNIGKWIERAAKDRRR